MVGLPPFSLFNGLHMLDLDIKNSASNTHGAPDTSQELVIANWDAAVIDSLF